MSAAKKLGLLLAFKLSCQHKLWLKLPLACLADVADTDDESKEDDVEDVDEGEQRQEQCAAARTGLLPLF